jgi:putative transposase
MATTRKRYTAAEKAKIALEALKGTMTQNELTSKYGVHSTQIMAWKKQLIEAIPEIFAGKRLEKDIEQATLIEELYKQIGQLKVELDWVKKKAELFNRD